MSEQLSVEQLLLNPFDRYRERREFSPVYQQSDRGIWSVFRYDDVERALSDYANFSSASRGEDGDGANPLGASMISSDPPRHRQLRSLVTQAFTPRTVAQLEGRIRTIVRQLLDPVTPASGTEASFDLIDTLAFPLPVIVIAELMGIPYQDRDRFKQWSDAVVVGTRAAGMAGRDPQREMSAYFLRLIEERRPFIAGSDEQADTGGDLISALLRAQGEGGHQLSTVDVLGFCVLLLVAGNETTTNLIGNAILCFDEYPENWEQLRARPDALLSTAIEEVLRYRSPVQSMFRRTTSAVSLGNQTIPAEEPVIAWIGSANRDERQFPEPDRFDITRNPNRHLAFSHGIHFCLGAPLARLEARVVLEELLERFARISRRREIPLEPQPSTIVYGVKHLPVTVRSA